MNFVPFAQAVNARLEQMSKAELFVVEPLTDLFEVYLAAFPIGSNPMFRERTVHDCSCCKQFIRNFGKVVSLEGNTLRTIWDVANVPGVTDIDPVYVQVAQHMDRHIKQLPITNAFRTKEGSYGARITQDRTKNETWNHFWGHVASRFRCDKPDEKRGEIRTQHQTSTRGLMEIQPQVLVDILDLIKEGSLYRGAEHERAIKTFQKIQTDFLSAPSKEIFVWNNLNNAVANFRNSVIGTLAVDLSNGVPMEDAVKMFESKVAPHNYKRTKALITPKMIDQALAKVAELGLDTALERRFAVLSDISVNEVIFVDRSVRGQMKDSLRDKLLSGTKKKDPDSKATEQVTIGNFMTYVVPLAKKMEVLVKNTMLSNFVSVTAPVHEDAKPLFVWDNNFAWSYQGEVADSIKERVKRAGGKVDAPLRVSLSWFNHDDLDLHAQCPNGHVYYGHKQDILDVDMNAGMGRTREPVENLAWMNPKNGAYTILVNQFSQRETSNTGFDIEIQCGEELQQFTYRKPVQGNIQCFIFDLIGGKLKGFKASHVLDGGLASKKHWGVETEKFVPVSVMMKSPNHWEGARSVGNRHWFFMLDGCVNPEPVRGFYNEFLRGDLTEHRKVFEILGAKTKCEPTSDQLSGVGFSEGRNANVFVKVVFENTERLYNVHF